MTTKSAGQGVDETQTTIAGEPGGQKVGEAHEGIAARQSSESAGHPHTETQDGFAGEPGGQYSPETQRPGAARHSSNFDGQQLGEAQEGYAVEAPGHGAPEAHLAPAGGDPSPFGGQVAAEAQTRSAVDALGHVRPEAQLDRAGGDNLAGQNRNEAQTGSAGQGAGHGHDPNEAQPGLAATRATITEIVEIGRQNAFAIRQRMRVKQATLSHIARSYFGYHTGLSEAERKHAMDAATKLIKAIASSEDHPAGMLVHATAAAALPWEDIEKRTEKALTKLARKLPAYAWVQQVRGFGDLSFARIIAETGDLSGYANPGKVWKRLGLAVFDNKAQRRTRDAEKAVEQGYSPRRRAVMWVAFDPVIRAQSAAKESVGQRDGEVQKDGADGEAVGTGQERDEAHTGVAGPYRLIYDAKKAEYLARGEAGEEGWTKLHSDRAAKRYASKRLLKDLWSAWRDDIAGQMPAEAHGASAGDCEPEAAKVEVKPNRPMPPRASRKRKD